MQLLTPLGGGVEAAAFSSSGGVEEENLKLQKYWFLEFI